MEDEFDFDKKVKQNINKYEELLAENKSVYFDSNEFVDIIEYYLSEYELDKAMNTVENALHIHPGNTELLLTKAQTLINMHFPDEATAILNIIDEDEYKERVIVLQLSILILKRELLQANDLVKDELETIHPSKIDFYSDIAYVYFDCGLYEEALPWFQKTYRLDPKDKEIAMDLSDCLYKTERKEEAINIYEEILDTNPYDAECWHSLGQIYFVEQEYNKALESFEYAYIVNPDKYEALAMMAHTYMSMENDILATEHFLRHAELNKKHYTSYYYAGLAFFNIDKYEKAQQMFEIYEEKSTEYSFNEYTICFNLAHCYFHMDKPYKALEYIDRAMNEREELNSNETHNLILLKGEILLDLGQIVEAEDVFRNFFFLNPTDEKNYMAIGKLYFNKNYLEEALIFFRTVEKLSPGYDLSYIFIAYIYLKQKKEEEFFFYFEKAFLMDPESILTFTKTMISPEEYEYINYLLTKKQILENEKPF